MKIDEDAAYVIGTLTGKADRLEAECKDLRSQVTSLRKERLTLKRKLRAKRTRVCTCGPNEACSDCPRPTEGKPVAPEGK